jgi:hypothetical protein
LQFINNYNLDIPEIQVIANIPDIDFTDLQGNEFDVNDNEGGEQKKGTLAKRFIVPPFSVLDTRQGYWMERKRAWLSLGIESEIGRGDDLLSLKNAYQTNEAIHKNHKIKIEDVEVPSWVGTSVFDPVLAEIMYTWFNLPGGLVIDPFAGGSVRGIVAGLLKYPYYGLDLSKEQIEANILQADALINEDGILPKYWENDSIEIDEILKGEQADFIFSCPPYFDLEQYSDSPNDLSNMDWGQFVKAYKTIVKKSISLLKNNRFACFVVGDIRDKKGFYRNFTGLTTEAFEGAGAMLYNEIILYNNIASLPIRVGQSFGNFRKVGKVHQNVLVFYKGDPKAVKDIFPAIEVVPIEEILNSNGNDY